MSNSRLIPALACVLTLAACGSPSATPTGSTSPTASATPTVSATPSPSATPTVKPVASLDGIKVTGKRLAAPKVSFKAPLAIDKTRVEVLKAGKGKGALADGYVTVHYYGVDGRTGKKFDESFDGAPVTFSLAQVVPGFTKGLTGQKAGSRVLIAMPGPDGYDSNGGNPDAGIEVGDTLVFVVDVISVSVAEPSGKVITPRAGLPTVTAGSGKPTVTIGSGNPPAKMVVQPLIQGTGAKVAKTDTIIARYVGYSWKTGKLIDDGFETPTTGSIADLIPGWQTGLVGKTVGSRVLLVLPPADGFPKGSNNPPVEEGDTVVYVVDLLFASAAA